MIPAMMIFQEAEERIIDRVWNDFGSLNKSQLLGFVHDLPEWQDPGSSRIPITVGQILTEGHRPDLADAIGRDLEIVRADRAFFDSL